MEDKEEDSLRIFGLKAAINILRFINRHEKVQYKQLQQFVSTHTLNARLRDLRNLSLIEHHFVREDVRKEWYEPTEKGRKVLECLEDLEKIIEE
jgi:DNA-binding HxlR family transcriptional regulator